MKSKVYVWLTLLLFAVAGEADAQTAAMVSSTAMDGRLPPIEDGSSSTSLGHAEMPDAPDPIVRRKIDKSRMKVIYQTHLRPFTHFALAGKFGLEGVGLDVATPLSNRWNLRGGVSYLETSFKVSVDESSAIADYGATLQSNSVAVDLKPRFVTGFLTLDWFPRYGSFRVSPGLTLYNGNRGTAVATVAGGNSISVGDGSYISDPDDPIRAYAAVTLGRKVAPRLTVGWGNMLPRAGEHFSFPFEAGFMYVGRPNLRLTLVGNACDENGSCGPINTDPSTQANLLKEESDVKQDLVPLRFYPIISTGVSYRF